MKEQIYIYDFDGTLTRRDSFLDFIRYTCGSRSLYCGLLLFSPLLILMKLQLYANGRAKERLFTHFFQGMSIRVFDDLCAKYGLSRADLLLDAARKAVNEVASNGYRIFIVSASVDRWVLPFFRDVPNVTVIGTQIEVENGLVTGRFSTPNCYGAEKVRRIQALLPYREQYKLIAHGDSRGDKEMLNYADQGYFRPFR
ncbi:MAG: haloacid dehalogenase-like hydrolase [Prevotella pleuritidis]|jgi:HAD phosphoserine phosphatase-like hydrolase, family IB|uniref:HAD family hydrolase n=1 Tax=Hoylesella pleuritidis TaxID=407975 RepID=UPI001CB350A6|nr:HAD family hydrolase [Hoylesella pleuritidis]MBF1554321.1 haloacid dehalogenase-like hydrolase [Hoylesella pleuritidis]